MCANFWGWPRSAGASNRQRRDAELTINFKRRELDETCRKLDGLIEAIADGCRAPGLQAKLDELEQSKARLQSEIDGAPAPSTRLHLNLAELYRKKVASLQEALPRGRAAASDQATA